MKEVLITTLRDKNSTIAQFRLATHQIGEFLALKVAEMLDTESYPIQTPLKETSGKRLKNPQVLVPVLRSGLALLPSFINFFPDAKVGLLGLRRDENTAQPHLYYANLPQINPDDSVLILEPMLATGNTISMVLDILIKNVSIKQERIILCSILAAPEGIEQIRSLAPNIKIIALQTDEFLNSQKFIVPGLGDFGDRYFGTLHDTLS